MASQAIDTYDRQQSMYMIMTNVEYCWTVVARLLPGGGYRTAAGMLGLLLYRRKRTNIRYLHGNIIVIYWTLTRQYDIYMMSQDTPSHACKPSSPCSCSPRRPAAPAAWKYRVTAAPALCFVFKGSSHCFLFPPESAEVCVLGVRVRVGVAGVQQVGGGGGDCKSWSVPRTEDTLARYTPG